MENSQIRLNKLTKTSTYRFKTNLVKEILEEFKNIMAKKSGYEQAVKIDEKRHPVYAKHEKIMDIIDEFVNNQKFNVKFSASNIVDGYGNIAVCYDGNPYLTIRLLLMAFRTHNNIVFFSKKYYAINTKIVETLNMISEKMNYATRVASVEYDTFENASLQNPSFFDLMIFIGDKREYQPLKRKISMPSIYSGYGNVDVFIESKDFKDLVLKIDKYSKENNININYFDNTSMEETLAFINKYDITDCFVVFSKNTDTIYKFISMVKAKNVYINRSPFENYKLEISENDLIYSKNIIMN
jgi:gamma-glutamyl phosphate reductase